MASKLKTIKQRHVAFKLRHLAGPDTLAQLTVEELDFLLRKIERLKAKRNKKDRS